MKILKKHILWGGNFFPNIWPVFCPNGSRGERVWGHNCLLSRMITHGYLRLPRDHPRLPRAAIQGSSCGAIQIFREGVYGTSEWQRQRHRQRHADHDVERGGLGGTTEWFHYFLAQPTSHCSLLLQIPQNHHCHLQQLISPLHFFLWKSSFAFFKHRSSDTKLQWI